MSKKKDEAIIEDVDLEWMDYSGILDMEVEFVADLGETDLSVLEILRLEKGSIIDLKKTCR